MVHSIKVVGELIKFMTGVHFAQIPQSQCLVFAIGNNIPTITFGCDSSDAFSVAYQYA
jgi:hypothetical protein